MGKINLQVAGSEIEPMFDFRASALTYARDSWPEQRTKGAVGGPQQTAEGRESLKQTQGVELSRPSEAGREGGKMDAEVETKKMLSKVSIPSNPKSRNQQREMRVRSQA